MHGGWMHQNQTFATVPRCGIRKALSGPTALGTSTEYFNAYSIVNADAIYNGQRSVNPNQRVFLLTRSGFAGEQRYKYGYLVW